MKINFGPVKSAVPLIDLIIQALYLQCLFQCIGCPVPILRAAHGILRLCGKLHVISEAKHLVKIVHQINDTDDLIPDLLRKHKDMSIILGKATNPHQAMEGTGQLMTVDQPQLCHSYRQIPIAVDFSLIEKHAARTVHRLYRVVLPIDFGKIHIVLVMIPMPGTDPKITVQNHGSADFLITSLYMLLPPEIFQLIPQDHAFRMKKRKARTFFLNAEQIQFLANFSVIALPGFLQAVHIFPQLTLFGK